MNRKKYRRYSNTIWSISQNERNRPDQTELQTNKQNINLLFCNNYRGNEALAVSHANNKGWTNFSRLTIIRLIYKFTKWKFYQIKRLWLLGFNYSRQQKYTRLTFSKPFALAPKKQKSPHYYTNLRGTLNRYEHLIKVRLHYSVLT